MNFSINNRLIVEVYQRTALRQEVKFGVVTPGQRDGFTGLKVLVGTILPDGREVPAGTTAYFREENLHTQEWTKRIYKTDLISQPFLLADLIHVDMFSTPESQK